MLLLNVQVLLLLLLLLIADLDVDELLDIAHVGVLLLRLSGVWCTRAQVRTLSVGSRHVHRSAGLLVHLLH